MANLTTVSATNVCDSAGTKITNATINFSPVTNSGQSTSYQPGGGGVAVTRSISAQVVGGAFSVALQDCVASLPTLIGYAVTIVDNLTGASMLGPGYGCIQPTGTTWNFDDYVPASQPGVTVTAGLPGVGFKWKGPWSGSNSYSVNDVVNYQDSSYINVVATAPAGGTAPVSTTTYNITGNLYDYTAAQDGYVIQAPLGLPVALAGYRASGFVYVHGITTGIIGNVQFQSYQGSNPPDIWAFYDADKSFLSGSSLDSDSRYPSGPGRPNPSPPLPVPSDAYYFRFWWDDNDNSIVPPSQVIVNAGPTLQAFSPYQPPTTTTSGGDGGTSSALPTDTTHWNLVAAAGQPGTNGIGGGGLSAAQAAALQPWAGKNILVLADSITARYPQWIADLCAKLGMNAPDVSSFKTTNVDAQSGRALPAWQNQGLAAAAFANTDLFVIEMLTNQNASSIGSVTDTPSIATSASMCAQLGYILDTVMAWKPGMRIVVLSTYQNNRFNYNPTTTPLVSGGQDSAVATPGALAVLVAINQGALAVCQSRAIPFVDLYNTIGINPSTFSLWLADNLHPNTAGYNNALTPRVAHELSRYGQV